MDIRTTLDGLLYLVRTSRQWRHLLPPLPVAAHARCDGAVAGLGQSHPFRYELPTDIPADLNCPDCEGRDFVYDPVHAR
jgi:hypothetical protein